MIAMIVLTINNRKLKATLSLKKLLPKYAKCLFVLVIVLSIRSMLQFILRIYWFCFSMFVRLSSARSIVYRTRFYILCRASFDLFCVSNPCFTIEFSYIPPVLPFDCYSAFQSSSRSPTSSFLICKSSLFAYISYSATFSEYCANLFLNSTSLGLGMLNSSCLKYTSSSFISLMDFLTELSSPILSASF